MAINRRVVTAAALVAGLLLAWFIWEREGRLPARDGAPAWSPDSSRIVYYSERDGAADLYIMNADGSGVVALTEGGADERGPAFSPDGSRIAYHTDADGNFEIYVMNANGSEPRRLTNHPGRDLAPAWSPDGTRIAFMSDRDARPEFDVYLMDPDGSNVERITTADTNWFPQFSPDGGRLALHIRRDVHLLDLETGALERLTQDPRNGMYPTWSPDGERIAFMSSRNGPTELFVMNADGTGQSRISTMARGSALDPRWSPDGAHIAFVHVPEVAPTAAEDPTAERAIYVLEVETGRLRRVSR